MENENNFLDEVEKFYLEETENLEEKRNLYICPKSRNITKTLLKNKNFDYIILDLNSLTIVPYIKIEDYSFKGINITPQVKTVELFLYLKYLFPKTKFIAVVDNGLTGNIKKIYSEYKENRNHSRKANLLSISGKNNIYRFNVSGLIRFFLYMDEYISYLPGEADFKIGFIINKILEKNKEAKILTISGDGDLILTLLKVNNHLHKLWKKTKGQNYYLFNREKFNNCFQMLYKLEINTPEEYLIYKTLMGDKSDNIPSIISSKKAVNLIKKVKEKYNSIHPKYVISELSTILKKDYNETSYLFKRNLALVNIFNEKVFTTYEKIRLEEDLKEYLFTEDKLTNKEKMDYLKQYTKEFCPSCKSLIEKYFREYLKD